MDIVKLSNKGQVLIPKAIRDHLRLPPGTEFVLSTTATGLVLTPKSLFPKTTGKDVRGILATAGRGLPGDVEIRANIKARLKAKDDASEE